MQNKKEKGFTLIEVLVAMFIFTMMMMATILAFSNLFQSYRQSKNIQEDIDNSQFAMNLMMKSLRTSSVIDGGDSGISNEVTIFDYSQKKCITYGFYNQDGRSFLGMTSASSEDLGECESEGSGDSMKAMTTGDVTGKFWWVKSDGDTNVVGSVTALVHVNSDVGGVDIQSSVSLRDYTVSGIELGI
ncbi:type II secretion system protein J [Patescibacteria group bacterium]